MTVSQQNIEMVSGDSRRIHIDGVRDQDARYDDSVVDLVGAQLRWGVLDRKGGDVLLTKRTENAGGARAEINVVDPKDGEVYIYLDPADTETMAGRYYHELEMEDVSGMVSTLMNGYLDIARDSI
jgi:hypothetical protein